MTMTTRWGTVQDFLKAGVDEKIFACGELVIFNSKETLYATGIGHIPNTEVVPNATTRFDLASLTKVVATLPSVLTLIESGQLDLNGNVKAYLPEFTEHTFGELTLAELLTHSAGLPSHVRFYEGNQDKIIPALLKVNLAAQPSTKVVYSDLGFMLLGEIVERVSGESLANYSSELYEKLGMSQTNFSFDEVVPTRVIGAPDDGNARFFNENCGHAGLVSTAKDLQAYLLFWSEKIKNSALFAAATHLQTEALDDSRGYGWVVYGGKQSFFQSFSEQAFGHTGYTGTSIMWDPQAQLGIVFLTNRVYCGTDDSFVIFRKKLYQLLRKTLKETYA